MPLIKKTKYSHKITGLNPLFALNYKSIESACGQLFELAVVKSWATMDIPSFAVFPTKKHRHVTVPTMMPYRWCSKYLSFIYQGIIALLQVSAPSNRDGHASASESDFHISNAQGFLASFFAEQSLLRYLLVSFPLKSISSCDDFYV